jgi:hypothetical protein
VVVARVPSAWLLARLSVQAASMVPVPEIAPENVVEVPSLPVVGVADHGERFMTLAGSVPP